MSDEHVAVFSGFRLHPFAVAQASSACGWTAEDGKKADVIRQLAHNEREARRMLAENDAILQRQLVYHADTFRAQAQRSMREGRVIQRVTLPGLDGQELVALVTRADLKDGGSAGQLYGRLGDDVDSMVTVAFVEDREAFTVLSPQHQISLQAEAREPGEIVVKRIDPSAYGVFPR